MIVSIPKHSLAALLLLSVGSAAFAKTYDPPLSMIVKAPVADVRAEPKARVGADAADPLQETQVEAGDPVLVFERQGDWARIEASDQMEYTHNDRWQGYPGWILWSALTS